MKAFLEKNKLGKYNEEETKRKEEERLREMEEEAAFARLCKIGDRCEVDVPNQPKRRATIKYVGEFSAVRYYATKKVIINIVMKILPEVVKKTSFRTITRSRSNK